MHMQVFWTRWLGLGTLAAVALLLPACNDGHMNFLGYTIEAKLRYHDPHRFRADVQESDDRCTAASNST